MHEAYDSESVFLSGTGVAVAIAPVGHDWTHSSHAVQRRKSMTGKPNEARMPNGFASVRTPVFRLFAMMLNISPRPGFSKALSRRARIRTELVVALLFARSRP